MEASRIDQNIPDGGTKVIHNHDGHTYNVTFQGVAPHSMILGACSKSLDQSVLEHIPPQLPEASAWDLERATPPPNASERLLCNVIINRKPDGTRSFSFTINQPEIWRSVIGLLDCPSPHSLWEIAYALRTRRRGYPKESRAVREIDLILQDLEESMRSELRYCKGQDVIHTKEDLLWLYYTIMMLSHGAPATLSSTAISLNVRLQHLLLLSPRELTMVFTDGKGTKSYHDIKILDLPRLNEQGIEIGFEPLLQQMLESGKYERRETPDRNIAVRGHQDDSVEVNAVERGEHEADIEDAHSLCSVTTEIDTDFASSFCKVNLE
jgi:hypothetical protein